MSPASKFIELFLRIPEIQRLLKEPDPISDQEGNSASILFKSSSKNMLLTTILRIEFPLDATIHKKNRWVAHATKAFNKEIALREKLHNAEFLFDTSVLRMKKKSRLHWLFARALKVDLKKKSNDNLNREIKKIQIRELEDEKMQTLQSGNKSEKIIFLIRVIFFRILKKRYPFSKVQRLISTKNFKIY